MIKTTRLDDPSFLRNKGGFTSRCKDLGVQWDWMDNCGHVKPTNPPKAIGRGPIMPWPEEGPEDLIVFVPWYGTRKCQHSWRIGDYLSVCSKCRMEIPHGLTVPAVGLTDDLSELRSKERNVILEIKKNWDRRIKKNKLASRPWVDRLFSDFGAPWWITGKAPDDDFSPDSDPIDISFRAICEEAIKMRPFKKINGEDYRFIMHELGLWPRQLTLPHLMNVSRWDIFPSEGYHPVNRLQHFLIWVNSKISEPKFQELINDVVDNKRSCGDAPQWYFLIRTSAGQQP